MAKVSMMFLSAALVSTSAALAQEALPVAGSIVRDITAGATQAYTIQLNTGDYIAGYVDQRGIVVVASAFLPDGSKIRTFNGPPTGKRQFAIVADTSGAYRLDIWAPSVKEAEARGGQQTESGSYELKVTEKLSADERFNVPVAAKYPSTAIDELRRAAARGETDTEAFWKWATQSGTPLVEPAPNDPRHALVTFLWRGAAGTRNVVVDGSFASPPDAKRMTHLEGTDVWYLTLRVPSGARFMYRLSPNDPLVEDGPRAAQRLATQQADPLNQRRWFCGPSNTRYECASLVELPDAPAQPWIARHEGTPAGAVTKHRIKSDILKNERQLSVYTPPGYRPGGRRYALAIVFDGSAYLTNVPTPTILDNLIAAGKIPATVAVLVDNPSGDARTKELPPNPQFAEFLAKELIPWVHTHYTVTNDPRMTVVAGSSFGGIAAVYAGLRHSEIFGNVLCQSGSFWWAPDHADFTNMDATTETGWLAKEFIKSPKLQLKFWMDAGVFEVDTVGTGGGILEPSRHMRDVLLAKGYDVSYHQFASGHDYINWRGTLGEGLIALIGTH